jgi:hypothetical protein
VISLSVVANKLIETFTKLVEKQGTLRKVEVGPAEDIADVIHFYLCGMCNEKRSGRHKYFA